MATTTQESVPENTECGLGQAFGEHVSEVVSAFDESQAHDRWVSTQQFTKPMHTPTDVLAVLVDHLYFGLCDVDR